MTANSADLFQKLLSEFPCLVPCDSSLSSFAGFVRLVGRDYRIRIASDCSRFDADDDLVSLLAPVTSTLNSRLKNASNPHHFLLEVRDVVETLVSHDGKEGKDKPIKPVETALPPAAYYERLLAQISTIGWTCVSSLDERMRTIDLLVHDNASRSHTIHVALSSDFPSAAPQCITSLPEEFHLDWSNEHSLSGIVSQFKRAVSLFEDFFRVVEDFDKHSWVLEPERPTWRDTSRRIALGKHTSVSVQLDARGPIKTYAECRFLGSELAVAPLRQKLNENMHLWDTGGKVLPRENLQRILDLTFPSRDSADAGASDDLVGECGICYAYRLEDRVPDIACDRVECCKPYHRECLVEWLRALPDTKESFGTLSGSCVYCEEAITVAVKGN